MRLRIIAVFPDGGSAVCPHTYRPWIAFWAREFRLIGATIWEEWS